MSAPGGLAYVGPLIEAYRAGYVSDHVHLGLFAPDGRGTARAGEDPLAAAQRAMAELHLERLGARDGETVLDVGCGLGGTLRLLNDRLSGAGLIGVNIDPRQLAVAREIAPRRGNRLRWVEADAGALDPAAFAYDRVLSLEAMFHFPGGDAFLRAARAALRPGGRAVVSTILLAPAARLAPPLAAAREVVLDGFAPWPESELTPDALLARARTAGFDVARAEDLTAAVGPTFRNIAPDPPPPEITGSATAELARLHAAGAMRYVMLTLAPAGQPGGNTQKNSPG